jgi:hyperosmotically inducible periplasmic protein
MRARHPLTASLWALLVAALVLSAQDRNASPKAADRIVREVRHELVMLPFYSVFDNLAYRVQGYTVTIEGQVTKPTLKTDAEKAIKRIEGVEKVVNNIEVLPLSPNDDRIRRAVYRAVYSQPGLEMYSLRAVPTIHIIVKNGNVTLAGAVANQGDKTRAEIAAKGVSGVFSVTNELLVSP